MVRYETEEERRNARKEQNRIYYEKTRENRIVKQKNYYEAHKDEISIQNKIKYKNSKILIE